MAEPAPAAVPPPEPADPTVAPVEVLVEFLRRLSRTLAPSDPVLVLRGSLLLKWWFGPDARPAADIDLECFERAVDPGDSRFRRAPVSHARALCLYATEDRVAPGENRSGTPDIEFEPIEPEDGTDLWEYNTPGERYYTLWVAHHRDDARGRLQIDLAQGGSYELSDIGVEEIELATAETTPFRFRAYTPEMLLAAKISWLIRGLKRPGKRGVNRPRRWTGEPKDLFDAHLLLTKANLRKDQFESALYAVGIEDKLDWLDLESFLDAASRMSDDDFGNWSEFQREHQALINCGPADMMRTVANRLGAILSDFREHAPFLRAINAAPEDELEYAVYADWLESRGDARANLLRLYIMCAFHDDNRTLLQLARRLLINVGIADEMRATRRALSEAMRATPAPWLCQLFGSPARFRRIRRENEALLGATRR